jgi:hypothetical protein
MRLDPSYGCNQVTGNSRQRPLSFLGPRRVRRGRASEWVRHRPRSGGPPGAVRSRRRSTRQGRPRAPLRGMPSRDGGSPPGCQAPGRTASRISLCSPGAKCRSSRWSATTSISSGSRSKVASTSGVKPAGASRSRANPSRTFGLGIEAPGAIGRKRRLSRT